MNFRGGSHPPHLKSQLWNTPTLQSVTGKFGKLIRQDQVIILYKHLWLIPHTTLGGKRTPKAPSFFRTRDVYAPKCTHTQNLRKKMPNSKWNSLQKQPFIDYCWRFGFDWSLRRNGLSNRRSPLSLGANSFCKEFHFEVVYRSTYEYI